MNSRLVLRRLGPLARAPLPTIVLYSCIVLQIGLALALGGRGWFSGDLIQYYVDRGGAPGSQLGALEPHVGHWQLVLITGFLLLFKVFGLTTYLPYLAVAIVVHVAIVMLMHRILLAVGARPWAAVFACLLLLSYGAGSEAFLVEAPVALTLAMLFGVISTYVLLRTDWSRRGVAVASGLLLLSVMTSLGGIIASVWVGLFAASRSLRMMLRVVAAPALLFVGWFVGWGREESRVLVSRTELLQIPKGAWDLLMTPFDDLLGGLGAGAALLMAVTLLVVTGAQERPVLASLSVAGFSAALLQGIFATMSQLPYGLDQVLTSRYRYLVLLLLLPALAMALDRLADVVRPAFDREQQWVAAIPVVAVAAGVFVNAMYGQYQTMRGVEAVGDRAKELLSGTIVATSTGEKVINNAVKGSVFSGDDFARLSEPDVREELPDLELSPENRIAAESQYFVTVDRGDTLALGRPVHVSSDSFGPGEIGKPGCRVFEATNDTPTLTIESYVGAGVRVRGGAKEVLTTLSRPEDDLKADPVSWEMTPGAWARIGTTAQLAELDITFGKGGRYTFCFGR